MAQGTQQVSQAPESMPDRDPTHYDVYQQKQQKAQGEAEVLSKVLEGAAKQKEYEAKAEAEAAKTEAKVASAQVKAGAKEGLTPEEQLESAQKSLYAQMQESVMDSMPSPEQTPEEKQLRKILVERSESALAQQQEQIASVQARIKAAQEEENIKPFLQYVDDMTGSTLAKGYKGKEDKLDELNKLQSVLAKQEMDSITKQLRATADKSALRMLAERNKNWRSFRNLHHKVAKDFNGTLMKDFDGIDKATAFFNQVDDGLESRQYGRVLQNLNLIARQISEEKGNMAEGDVNRVWFQDLEAWTTRMKTLLGADGKLPQRAIQPLIDMVARAKIEKKKFYQRKFDHRQREVSAMQVPDEMKPGLTQMLAPWKQKTEGFYPSLDVNMPTHDFSREAVSQGPEVGAVEEGMRFKGGDPSNPQSWEPVQ